MSDHDTHTYSDVISFYHRCEGWYEDEPDYYYDGSIGSSYVKLCLPKMPGRYGSKVKVTISVEPIEEPDHVYVDAADGSNNEMCLVCGAVSEYGTKCPGER